MMDSSSRKIGLVLGGGGAKGSAHIGVLNALEALRLPIDLLTGTSIGGLVGAFYAVGLSPLAIEQQFRRATGRAILERDPGNTGLLGTRKIEMLLREVLGSATFADTRFPLALVTVDIVSGEEVVLQDGPLVDAVIATTAVPGIFPPVIRDEQVLVDGGVLNNVPIDVAGRLGAQRTIAVDLGRIDTAFHPNGSQSIERTLWSPRRLMPRNQVVIAERALAIMMARATDHRMQQHPADVLIRPGVASMLPFDFSRTFEGRLLGERATFEQRAALESISAWRMGDETDENSGAST